MASPNNTAIKIHDQCHVPPQSSSQILSLTLTFFDLIWLRFHPVERIFFYSLPTPHSHRDSLLHKVVPKLKTSLSLTLQHFLPLAGNIVWPSDSHKPIIQYNPGDGVSLIIAESNEDFNHFLENSPREASKSRSLVPHLESSDSHASIISLQITLFPNFGFSIGISAHHAVLDGKSSTMFIKAWAYLCQINEESPTLVPELVPFFDKDAIEDPNGRDMMFMKNWRDISSQLDPTSDDNSKGRTLKIMSNAFPPLVDNTVRATFELTRGDLEKIKKRVSFMWDTVDVDVDVDGAQTEPNEPVVPSSKPLTLSTFVLTCAYVSVCIAKAIEESENDNKLKFVFGFTVDCRARLEPPVPENYFGNCVCGQFVFTEPEDFTKEHGLVIVAKKIHDKIKKLGTIEGALDGIETLFHRASCLMSEGIKSIGVAGSTRFGVYGIDFGWGRPAKVEITSVDRSITIGMAESKDGKGGVEVGIVLNKHVMGLFHNLFHAGLY